MGFPNKFIDLVLKCVCLVSYRVLLNGNPLQSFRPERSLRQGDPLSPYLFIMCAEVLSFLLRKAQDDGVLQGFKMGDDIQPVNHLFFVDDSILFSRAIRDECNGLSSVFEMYSNVSGLVLNLEKSNIYYEGRG